MWLEAAGTSLVIEDVRLRDRAEYRCRVHFRLSPSWTQRLLLSVTDSLSNLVIVNDSGIAIGGERVGPLPEDSRLHFKCKASYGSSKVESLVWLLNGQQLDSSWEATAEGTAINKVVVDGLHEKHHHNHLTCRLTTSDSQQSLVKANITDVSIVIVLFRVPEVKLRVEIASGNQQSDEGGASRGGDKGRGRMIGTAGGAEGGGGGWEVNEGSSVTFVCSVIADPPAYNVTWLHNGKVVGMGGRRWRRDNATLVITPVTRTDGGLYTCLASNTEGDGHSNALLLRIAHSPQCSDPTEKRLVVATNKSINISCKMDALPENITFTWRVLDVPPKDGQEDSVADARGGIITGDAPPPHHPGLIDLTPDHFLDGDNTQMTASPGSSSEASSEENLEGSSVWRHRVDGSDPTRSIITLSPSAPQQLLCYARNRLGRTRIPCTYLIAVVDPPEPLRLCNVTAVDVTRVEVKCAAPAPAKDVTYSGLVPQVNYSPGLSFVRSSEVRTTANMQVWTGVTLLANISSDRPEFVVDGLPPASPLKMILYAVSPHARSEPVQLNAYTLPRVSVQITEKSPVDSDQEEFDYEYNFWNDIDSTMSGVVGGVIGGACAMIMVLSVVIVVIWCRKKRRNDLRRAEEEDASYAPSIVSPTISLSIVDSQLQPDVRPSVYCVGSGSAESQDTPWLETSITPLVAPATPLSPSQPRVRD
ncbi:hypothetical protein SK128_005531 [Halocaridina rubra]|uniref:Ig-like domain-containing protein n=1 Tax=Halocaridina rubra TaxID=373956 RepID=A0AAN8X5A0_HALRR